MSEYCKFSQTPFAQDAYTESDNSPAHNKAQPHETNFDEPLWCEMGQGSLVPHFSEDIIVCSISTQVINVVYCIHMYCIRTFTVANRQGHSQAQSDAITHVYYITGYYIALLFHACIHAFINSCLRSAVTKIWSRSNSGLSRLFWSPKFGLGKPCLTAKIDQK